MIHATTRLTLLLCIALTPLAIHAQTTEARTATLTRILADYDDAQKKRDPLLATQQGDKRFNDQLPDLSASADNTSLAEDQAFVLRLAEVDLTGLPEKTRRPAEALLNTLIAEQQSTASKNWQHPTYQFLLLDSRLNALASTVPFLNAKDYDDYLTRLKKLPQAFSQIMTNLQLAADRGQLPDAATIAKIQTQVRLGAAQPADLGPFAAPLKRFPSTVPPEQRKRIAADLLEAITADVIPAYNRVGRFVAARATP